MELITGPITQPRFRYLNRKGVYPVILDFEYDFKTLGTKPIMANDLDLSSEEGRTLFNELVYTRYEGDVFTNVPRCPCSFLHSGEDEGETCPKCGYVCESPTNQTIQPVVWIKAPVGVDYFINVQMYSILKRKMMSQGLSVLDWLIDPKYRPPRLNMFQEEMLIDILKRLGVKRGMRGFYDRFDDIMHALYTTTRVIYKADKRETFRLIKLPTMRQIAPLIELVRDRIFSTVLPFPSKIGFVLEKVGLVTYVDPEMKPALNALLSIAKADKECRSLTDAESRTARAVRDLGAYYEQYDYVKVYHKKGISRKLVYGMTPHFTLRGVITSEHGVHDHEVITLPWGSSVFLYKLHIANKVMNEGYTPNEFLSLIYDNIQRKHIKLEQIFDELERDSSSGKGMSTLLTRFPALKHNSSTRFFAKVNRDPRNVSIKISLLTVKASNAD